VVPQHDPILLAKQVATIDHISAGRFLFGVAAGWLTEEDA
jgi:alkanesulfonate monooxygenase SsuD/methylene tetrahydromethanopterin reductase-like flavin-dependent oxidoreductase (luciferase family)